MIIPRRPDTLSAVSVILSDCITTDLASKVVNLTTSPGPLR